MLAPVIFGFAMATLGVALLILGEVPFVRGTRIPARRARIVGIVLVSFLPLALGVTQLLNAVFGREAINGMVVTWSIFGCCWLVVVVTLYRVISPKKARKPAAVSRDAVAPMDMFGAMAAPAEPKQEANPWTEAESAKKVPGKKAESVKNLPAAKTRKPAVSENNPFDFT